MKFTKQFLLLFLVVFVFSCNKSPEKPVCVYPLDSAVNITDKNLELKWTAYDENGDELYYDIYLQEDTSEMFPLDSTTEVVTKYYNNYVTVSNLKDSTMYVWIVRVNDGRKKMNFSRWVFTTGKINR